MTAPRLDAGSFRDRESRVFYRDGKVHRALSRTALEEWTALQDSPFFDRLVEERKVVATKTAEMPTEVLESLGSAWVAALEHERIPFLSYPYEWSFSMLRDAAALQLELIETALEGDMTLKDASSYNVQWRGVEPTFIDIPSFERWVTGDPWVGYLQFCQLYLYPLFLTAYRDLPFQPWLRGAIDGITAEECNRILRGVSKFRPGVLVDVYLQAKLQAKTADSDDHLRTDLRSAGFRKEMIVNNVRRLRKIVDKLKWKRSRSEWAGYAEENSYDRENRRIKEDFVRGVASDRRFELAWDLGANTGAFSRIVAEHADYVVAADADHLAVDRMYQRLSEEGTANILPLVMNLADMSPGLGWRMRERKAFVDRRSPDLVLALALIHHVVITANVPLPEFVAWLGSLGSHLVIEFVTKDDAMVKKLLRNKKDIYDDYEVSVFEQCLEQYYQVERRTLVQDGHRILYYAQPKVTTLA